MNAGIPLVVFLVVLVVLLAVLSWKSGSIHSIRQLPRALRCAMTFMFSEGTTRHNIIRIFWLAILASYLYRMVEPLFNRDIYNEYVQFTGGLLGAWFGLSFLFLPYFVIYCYMANRLSPGAGGKVASRGKLC